MFADHVEIILTSRIDPDSFSDTLLICEPFRDDANAAAEKTGPGSKATFRRSEFILFEDFTSRPLIFIKTRK